MKMSANQVWKESKTTLSFKDWLTREKEKFYNLGGEEDSIIPNKPLSDSISRSISEIRNKSGLLKTDVSKNKTLGISNIVIISAGLIIVGAIAYKFYKNKS